MSLITFDVKFKNKVDNESVRLLPDSELQQLKLMICGKYKIYDLNTLFIYYKGNLIEESDMTKIKDIFKMKKVRIEISETPLEKKRKLLNIIANARQEPPAYVTSVTNFYAIAASRKKNT